MGWQLVNMKLKGLISKNSRKGLLIKIFRAAHFTGKSRNFVWSVYRKTKWYMKLTHDGKLAKIVETFVRNAQRCDFYLFEC